MISIVAEMGWKIHQMDVKTAFLNGLLHEVYLEQPKGLRFMGERLVCVGWKRPCMDWSKLLELGIRELTRTCCRLGFRRVRLILTYISLWLEVIRSFFCDMLMTCLSQGGAPDCSFQEKFCFRVRDDWSWDDALLFGYGGLARGWTCFPRARKICN